MADSARDFPSKDLKIYQQLDQRTARLQLAFGLRCPPPLCGSCWDDCKVEATVLETFPLAEDGLPEERGRSGVLCARSEGKSRRFQMCTLPGELRFSGKWLVLLS